MPKGRSAFLVIVLFALLPAIGAGVADGSVGIGIAAFLAIAVGGWLMAWALSGAGRR
jgi:hypothetical protein